MDLEKIRYALRGLIYKVGRFRLSDKGFRGRNLVIIFIQKSITFLCFCTHSIVRSLQSCIFLLFWSGFKGLTMKISEISPYTSNFF